MTKNLVRLLVCAALVSGLGSCASTSPPTVESYTAQLAKTLDAVAYLGRYTIPPPDGADQPPIACACAVTPRPNSVKPVPPPRGIEIADVERGLMALRAAAAARVAGKPLEVRNGSLEQR